MFMILRRIMYNNYQLRRGNGRRRANGVIRFVISILHVTIGVQRAVILQN